MRRVLWLTVKLPVRVIVALMVLAVATFFLGVMVAGDWLLEDRAVPGS